MPIDPIYSCANYQDVAHVTTTSIPAIVSEIAQEYVESPIEWDSIEGERRFNNISPKQNLLKLLANFECQAKGTYCAIASSVIALNALDIKPAVSKAFGEYKIYTQQEFFDSLSNIPGIEVAEVEKRGMPLLELELVFKSLPVKVTAYEAHSLAHEEMKDVLIRAIQQPNASVLALYQRKVIGQEQGGHWSPLAAYDKESDSFLVLDVARFKHPPVWVKAQTLLSAMQTLNIYNKSRGFLVIEKL